MILNNRFIESQKEVLLQKKSRIEKEVKSLKRYPDYGDTSDDQTMELTDFENNASIENELERVLVRVKKALTAIEKGEYGVCKKCRSLIEKGRLEIMPEADLCVICRAKKS